MQKIIALLLFILLLPVFLFLLFLIKSLSSGPFIFTQKRAGKNKKIFTMYKIRTMVTGAESLKSKVQSLNEADGPVFKIKDDPRYTKLGKWLALTGLDELPQLWNIVKDEMAFVGPRPLPVAEARKVPKKYQGRFSVLPGITSFWVVAGSHKLSFQKWMELDLEYVERKSFWYDIEIALKTILLIFSQIFHVIFKRNENI